MSRFGMGGPGAAAGQDASQVDTAEQVYISSLALLKMLKHGTLHVTNDARRTQARVGWWSARGSTFRVARTIVNADVTGTNAVGI